MDTTIDPDALQLLAGEEARLYVGDLERDQCGTYTCALSCTYSCENTCELTKVI
ncbi:ALQxL family class IV lanthipeptide [Streptomyces sp. 4F14]|uniref:ALQxL family class IV lanthipeptide n=1 Tax=Streptomyces sp. 4F14 TaxID=3394380 RepID=UPI003A8735C0